MRKVIVGKNESGGEESPSGRLDLDTRLQKHTEEAVREQVPLRKHIRATLLEGFWVSRVMLALTRFDLKQSSDGHFPLIDMGLIEKSITFFD